MEQQKKETAQEPKTIEQLNSQYQNAAFQTGHAIAQIKQFETLYNQGIALMAQLIEEIKKLPPPAPTSVGAPTLAPSSPSADKTEPKSA